MSKSNGLGTFGGVFTPSILTILGLVLFLRLGYVVGLVGLGQALLIIALASLVSVLTSISLAAIATNLEVKGGGVYYIISRTLGHAFGGAIGLVLFLALSISVGFYSVGLAEGVSAIAGWDNPISSQMIAAGTVVLVTVVAWFGAEWATRLQYVVMAALAAALVSFALGAWGHWNSSILAANFGSFGTWDGFWIAFAVFFPAVTGFTQGVNMSGDLADPARSIPLGTASAVGLSILVYVAAAVLLAASLPWTTLSTDFGAMRAISISAPLIDAGIIAATLSSALASLMGGPRILQSLAKDEVFPVLKPFAEGGTSNNPRRGVMLGAAIALMVVAIGDLNLIASIVSMFFVVTYGLLNYATYFEARARSPSFRPALAWYDPRASLAGGLLSLGVILAINLVAGLIAISVVYAIYAYVQRTVPSSRWADGQRSFHLQRVREHLLQANHRSEHPRDWRPQILAFSDDRERRYRLLKLAEWFEGHSGLTTVVRIIEGRGRTARRQLTIAERALAAELVEEGLTAFPLVISALDIDDAVPAAVQSVGVGPTRINTVLVNWLDPDSGRPSEEDQRRYLRNVHSAFLLGCNLLLLDADEARWAKLEARSSRDRQIDVWWLDNESGRLMLVLAYLVTRDEQWRGVRIRVLSFAHETDGADRKIALEEALREVRIRADVEVVSEEPKSTDLVRFSGACDLVFLAFGISQGKFSDWRGLPLEDVLRGLPVTVLVMAAEHLDLTADPDARDDGNIDVEER